MASIKMDKHVLLETEQPTTLAETVFYLPHPKLREELEQFRVKYEMQHGLTDLTKRYTSTWPQAQQEWLIENDPSRYFRGLPSFAKAYIKGKMQLASRAGNLDDMPATYLKLFISGQMDLAERHR